MNLPRTQRHVGLLLSNMLLFWASLSMLPNIEALVLVSRRKVFVNTNYLTAAGLILGTGPAPSCAAASNGSLQDFAYSSDWVGTGLPFLSLNFAAELPHFDMGRWPDPILRRAARPVEDQWFGTQTLETVTKLLRKVAQENEAVGLAAQQCGIDARIVYLELPPNRRQQYVTMINPIITERSPETEMRVWTEYCLVLPPSFRATVLRDAWVVVQYLDVTGTPHQMRFTGETARAVQHELDHDRGILTLDHVGMEDLENDVMRRIESKGHDERQELAFQRTVVEI
mmetsp:Transcript_33320/g.50264  ORF Transcript_33320/g.50264 Transcript_33320/m.50264 type:complete len:284 (+) Transcript_33320:151-1002(+)